MMLMPFSRMGAEKGALPVVQALDGVAGMLAGDPGDAAGFLRDLAVEGERGFQGDERAFGSNPAGEIFVEMLGLFFQDAADYLDSGAAKFGQAFAGYGGIGVAHGGHYFFYSGGDDGFGAGASAAGGAAGFERYVESRAASFLSCFFQCDDFGMVAAVVVVEAFADDFAVFDQDCADDWVRMREGYPAECANKGAHHPSLVCGGNRAHVAKLIRA